MVQLVTCGAAFKAAPSARANSRANSRHRVSVAPQAFLQKLFGGGATASKNRSAESQAVQRLLSSIEGTERGLATTKEQRAEVLAAVEELAQLGAGSTTTAAGTLSATWKLLWTTEKETLFILEKAGLFGTAAGEVYQVIDVDEGYLQNVITFPPEGAFIVDSSIDISGSQRVDFKFNSATLKLPAGRSLKLPPFGKGWFDTVYADATIRVAFDSRGDTLVVARAGPPQRFS